LRILSLDVGEVRIGVAVCDELQISVSPLTTVVRVGSLKKDIAKLLETVNQESPDLILLGMPTSADSEEGPQAKRVRGFADALTKSSKIPVKFWDESLTTVEANERMIEAGVSRQKRKELVDQWAAKLLLESYLEYLAGEKNTNYQSELTAD
jgi:putative Holliday junction resolvase